MKRLLIFLFISIISISVFSQNTLTVFQKDGQEFSFGFDETPVITYTDNDMVIKTSNSEVQFQLLNLHKFTFTEGSTSVKSVDTDKASFELDSYFVHISGAKAGIEVLVTCADGKSVGSYKTDTEGTVTFSIAELPNGLYNINSEQISFKVLKK